MDQTCGTEDDSLCGSWMFVASLWLATSCCDVVSLGEMPPQVSISPLEEWLYINDKRYGSKITKGGVPELESKTCKNDSIGQLNAQTNV